MRSCASCLVFGAAAVAASSVSAFTLQPNLGAASARSLVRRHHVDILSNVRQTPFLSSSQPGPLSMADSSPDDKSKLPMLLDPGTKGGALFLSLILFFIPIVGYAIGTNFLGWDGVEAGKWIGAGFTVVTTFLWVGSYILRVATKDMTYAKQLKDYENAVIAKRLEELDEDEIQALVEDIERDDF